MGKLLVGCDPEMTLRNPNSGQIVSAEGIVPGDKLNPHRVKKGTVQVDGFAAEIGIDPARTAEEFADNVQTVLEELKTYTRGYDFVFEDHTVFDEEVYIRQSDKGRELGCLPDYSAYTRIANPVPVPNPRSLRTFSGHIHIGWTEDEDVTSAGHFQDCISVAKQMDYYLGGPSLAWSRGTVRRSLYGKAGCFRVKGYGMEYRTPDNGWLVSRDRMLKMFGNAKMGMDALYKGSHVDNNYKGAGQQCINGGDYNKMVQYLKQLGIPHDDIPKVVKPKVETVSIVKPKKLVMNG